MQLSDIEAETTDNFDDEPVKEAKEKNVNVYDTRSKSSPNVYANTKQCSVADKEPRPTSVKDIPIALDEEAPSEPEREPLDVKSRFLSTAEELKEVTNFYENISGDFNIKPTAVYSEVLKRKEASLRKKSDTKRSESVFERRPRTEPEKEKVQVLKIDPAKSEAKIENYKPSVFYRLSSPYVATPFRKSESMLNFKPTELSPKRPSFSQPKTLDRKRGIYDGSNFVAELPPMNDSIEVLNIETECVIPETPLSLVEVPDFQSEEKPIVSELAPLIHEEQYEEVKKEDSEESYEESHEEEIYDNFEPLPDSQFHAVELAQNGSVIINIIKQADWPSRLGKKNLFLFRTNFHLTKIDI
jgi:hypothetical protein